RDAGDEPADRLPGLREARAADRVRARAEGRRGHSRRHLGAPSRVLPRQPEVTSSDERALRRAAGAGLESGYRRPPKSTVTTVTGPLSNTPGADGTLRAPTATCRHVGSSRFARCSGLFIQRSTIASLEIGVIVHRRFSPTA